NGDGFPDIATGWEQSGQAGIYLHPGKRAVQEPWPYIHLPNNPNIEDALLVDLDGDGHLDLVTCCEGKTCGLFFHWSPPQKELQLRAATSSGNKTLPEPKKPAPKK